MRMLYKYIIFIITLSLTRLARAQSANGDDDLICHSTDASQCYPRIFVPTEEFQIVYDDQEIPKGLHVRMNMQTGQKEAKLYDPSQDTDVVNAVQVLPEGSETEGGDTEDVDARGQKIANEMYRASAEGAIKQPLGSGGDATAFENNVDTLKKLYDDNLTTNEQWRQAHNAFDELEELCHDIYWGLRLVQETELLDRMYPSLCLHKANDDIASESAALLMAALQNNKAALEVFIHFLESKEGHVKFMDDLVAVYRRRGGNDAAIKARYTSLISKLVAHDDLLAAFVAGDGLKSLSRTLDSYEEDLGNTQETGSRHVDKARLRRRAADLAADHIVAAEEANLKFRSIHETQKSVGTIVAPEVLKRALANRTEWCQVFHTAYSIWTWDTKTENAEWSEANRWRFVPVTCDVARYDLKTGKALPGAIGSHDEL